MIFFFMHQIFGEQLSIGHFRVKKRLNESSIIKELEWQMFRFQFSRVVQAELENRPIGLENGECPSRSGREHIKLQEWSRLKSQSSWLYWLITTKSNFQRGRVLTRKIEYACDVFAALQIEEWVEIN